jgi:hypothetical protein
VLSTDDRTTRAQADLDNLGLKQMSLSFEEHKPQAASYLVIPEVAFRSFARGLTFQVTPLQERLS